MTAIADPTAIARWFLTERGIKPETLAAWGVDISPTGNVILPYPNGEKQRPDPTVPLPPDKRRFYFTGGVQPMLFSPLLPHGGDDCFLVEGETDCMRLWQEFHEAGHTTDVYGISGINTWRPALAEALERYKRVFVVLDNDEDYNVSAQVDAAWRHIRHDLGGKGKRIPFQGSWKDVCEFFLQGNDLEVLALLAQRRSASRFRPVDFTMPPPPVNWLLDGWIARGDLTILAGMGGLGKSWVTMALALAVIRGDATCLDEPVSASGSVLYVDEENPEDVIYSRMLRLGLDPATDGGRLRYLWNQGVRLDRDAEPLLDEVLDMRPALFVLDSLTRLHSKDENASGEIGALLNDAVKPLARESGAGVVLIHHHNKNGTTRGSSDIDNAADAVIAVYPHGGENSGQFRMRLNKSRRRQAGAEIIVGIQDEPDGSVSLVASPPFISPIF